LLSGIWAGWLVTPDTLAKICVRPGVAAVKRAWVIWLPLLLLRAGSDVLNFAAVPSVCEKVKEPTVFVMSMPLAKALAWKSR
jgi:hypothetical protein